MLRDEILLIPGAKQGSLLPHSKNAACPLSSYWTIAFYTVQRVLTNLVGIHRKACVLCRHSVYKNELRNVDLSCFGLYNRHAEKVSSPLL